MNHVLKYNVLPAATIAAALGAGIAIGYEAGSGSIGPGGCAQHVAKIEPLDPKAINQGSLRNFTQQAAQTMIQACHPGMVKVGDGETPGLTTNTYQTEYRMYAGSSTALDITVVTGKPASAPGSWLTAQQVIVESAPGGDEDGQYFRAIILDSNEVRVENNFDPPVGASGGYANQVIFDKHDSSAGTTGVDASGKAVHVSDVDSSNFACVVGTWMADQIDTVSGNQS